MGFHAMPHGVVDTRLLEFILPLPNENEDLLF
jgi:hypothetical protein